MDSFCIHGFVKYFWSFFKMKLTLMTILKVCLISQYVNIPFCYYFSCFFLFLKLVFKNSYNTVHENFVAVYNGKTQMFLQHHLFKNCLRNCCKTSHMLDKLPNSSYTNFCDVCMCFRLEIASHFFFSQGAARPVQLVQFWQISIWLNRSSEEADLSQSAKKGVERE